MKKHKSEKIEEVVYKYDGKLNLHEIKAKTGAGSGHKYTKDTVDSNPIIDKSTATTKILLFIIFLHKTFYDLLSYMNIALLNSRKYNKFARNIIPP